MIIFIIIVGATAYLNSMKADFIWDDLSLVRDNVAIKQFSNVKTFEKTESVHSEATPENKHRVVRTKSSLIPAIIDMYLLSRCKEIVITPASTFSECAWYLSGCSARIFHPINKVYLK